MAEDMIEMARSLKSNATLAKTIITTDNEVWLFLLRQCVLFCLFVVVFVVFLQIPVVFCKTENKLCTCIALLAHCVI